MTPYESRIAQLAELSKDQYERQRKEVAKALHVRASVLDKDVAEARKHKSTLSAGFAFEDLQSWPSPVNAGELLQRLASTFRQFVVLGPKEADAAALWTLSTYAFDAFNTSPLLALESATPRCGKTTLLSVTAGLVFKPITASNISPSALYRFIDAFHPTMLLDEADTWAKADENLRGILNSGHTRAGAFAIRCEGEGTELRPRSFSTWCPKVIALIGRLPATLQDRSIVITLRRKLPSESAERYRSDKQPLTFLELRRQCLRWAEDHFEALQESDPRMPERLNDRAADNWRPLAAIADLAGGDWPTRARASALGLSGADHEVANLVEILLGDIHAFFDGRTSDRARSQELADYLGNLPDRPWSEFNHGKPITTNQLARQLEPLEVRPKKVRFGETTAQGYERSWFADAFLRHLPPSQTGTPEQTFKNSELHGIQTGTRLQPVPVSTARNPLINQGCSGVPVGEPPGGTNEIPLRCRNCLNYRAVSPTSGNCEELRGLVDHDQAACEEFYPNSTARAAG